jgi:hypothetical protein
MKVPAIAPGNFVALRLNDLSALDPASLFRRSEIGADGNDTQDSDDSQG